MDIEQEKRMDNAENTKILKLTHETVIRMEERQQCILTRLNKINGTVADYNKNKLKMDANKEAIKMMVTCFGKHEDEHKKDSYKYISKKQLTLSAIIMGLIISANTILSYIF